MCGIGWIFHETKELNLICTWKLTLFVILNTDRAPYVPVGIIGVERSLHKQLTPTECCTHSVQKYDELSSMMVSCIVAVLLYPDPTTV